MLDQLNPAQRKAVKTLQGPLLVLAGAGTGKTRVVTFRIANLIRHRTRPERILAVTFTNKAATEMQHRIRELIGKRKEDEKPHISTFHSHCLKVLRRHIRLLGYPERFSICDRGDQESVARRVLREVRVPERSLRPGDLLYHISTWKNQALSPDQAARQARTDREHLASMGYRRYQRELKSLGAVDFDDLLLLTEELFRNFPETRDQEAGMFDHVLVDEYQDTNQTQYRIIRSLASDHRNLCVVGDDDQAIYGWRGAEVTHILRFSRDWPDATVVRLEDNYRCTEAILTLANRVIAYNKQRHDKTLRAARPGGEPPRIEQHKDEVEEARAVVADIRRRIARDKLDPKDFAILFRTNEQPRPFETELRKHKVPYILLGGMSFFDRKEVRDLLCYLKLIDAPEDETSLRRIINRPARGIGDSSVDAIVQKAVENGESMWEVMKRSSTLPVATKVRTSVRNFVQMIEQFQQMAKTGQLPVAELTRRLIEVINYRAELERQYQEKNDQESRWAAVEEVVNTIAIYEQRSKKKKASIRGFLDEVALNARDMDRDKEKELSRNAVALMTIHSAKGLEFPHVYLVGLEEGILPHHRSAAGDGEAVDEERRLCYVAITRAQERLTLSMALTRMKWGKPRETQPSRFLFEIVGKADNPHARSSPKAAKA